MVSHLNMKKLAEDAQEQSSYVKLTAKGLYLYDEWNKWVRSNITHFVQEQDLSTGDIVNSPSYELADYLKFDEPMYLLLSTVKYLEERYTEFSSMNQPSVILNQYRTNTPESFVDHVMSEGEYETDAQYDQERLMLHDKYDQALRDGLIEVVQGDPFEGEITQPPLDLPENMPDGLASKLNMKKRAATSLTPKGFDFIQGAGEGSPEMYQLLSIFGADNVALTLEELLERLNPPDPIGMLELIHEAHRQGLLTTGDGGGIERPVMPESTEEFDLYGMSKLNMRKHAATFTTDLLQKITEGLERISANYTVDGAEAVVNFQPEGVNEPQHYHIAVVPINTPKEPPIDTQAEGSPWGPEGPPPGISNARKLNMRKISYKFPAPIVDESTLNFWRDETGTEYTENLEEFIDNPDKIDKFYESAQKYREYTSDMGAAPRVDPMEILKVYELEYKRWLSQQYQQPEKGIEIENELTLLLEKLLTQIQDITETSGVGFDLPDKPGGAAIVLYDTLIPEGISTPDIDIKIQAFHKILNSVHFSGFTTDYILGADSEKWLTWLSNNSELPQKWSREFMYSGRKLNMKKTALNIGGVEFPDETYGESQASEVYKTAESFIINYIWSGLYEQGVTGPDGANVIQEDADKIRFSDASTLVNQLLDEGFTAYLNQSTNPVLQESADMRQALYNAIKTAIFFEGEV